MSQEVINDVLTTADQFGERAGKRFRQEIEAALQDWQPAAPLTGVRQKHAKRLPLAAWLRQQAGEPVTQDEMAALEEVGWSRQREIQIPLAAVSPITRATDGDDVIPKTISDRIIEEIDTYAVVRQVCEVMTTAQMDQKVIPIFDDRSNTGALVTSTIDLATSVNPSITSLTLNCKTIHSKPVVIGRTLLRDAAVDVEGLVIRALGSRIGRALNALLTTGTGLAGQPEGIQVAAPVLKTSASTSAFTWKEVHDLMVAIDPVYRPKCKWMMNESIAALLYRLTDDNNQPIVWRDLTGQQPDRLFGFPVVYNPDMPSEVSAGEKVILFGDFSRYILREVPRITLKVLQETYAQYDAVGFLALYDFDAGLAAATTSKAIGALQIAESSS